MSGSTQVIALTALLYRMKTRPNSGKPVLEYMGVPEEVTANAHDAEFDVEWTSKVIIKLMKTSRWMTGWNEQKQKRRLERNR